jgi:hypothetical protein
MNDAVLVRGFQRLRNLPRDEPARAGPHVLGYVSVYVGAGFSRPILNP